MKKYIKIICITILCILLTGCGKEFINDKTLSISNGVVNIYKNYNYDYSKESKDIIKILDNFKTSELSENKIVNLSNMDIFNEENKNNKEDSYGVFKNGNNYYIKYSDIPFVDIDESDIQEDGMTSYAILNVNGYEVYLSRDIIPVLERKSINTEYRYMGNKVYSNYIDVYYRSYYNASGLIVRTNFLNDEITNVETIYMPYVDEMLEEDSISNNSKIVTISLTIVFFIIFALLIFFIIRKVALAQKM